jgi:primosomal protein N'
MTTELISQLIIDSEKMQKDVKELLNSTQNLIQENNKIKKEIQEVLGERAKQIFKIKLNAEIQLITKENDSPKRLQQYVGKNLIDYIQDKQFISDDVEFNTVMNDVHNLIKDCRSMIGVWRSETINML